MTKRQKRFLRILGTVFFVLYLALLFHLLFFSDAYFRDTKIGYQYNLKPFSEIRRFLTYHEILGTRAVIVNLLGNIVAFMPFGFLLPVVRRKKTTIWAVFSWGFLLTLSVETMQLITQVGVFDVDDLMLNTLGSLLGYGCYRICRKVLFRPSATAHSGEEPNPGESNAGKPNPGESSPGEFHGEFNAGGFNPGESDPGEPNPGDSNPGESNPEKSNPGESSLG